MSIRAIAAADARNNIIADGVAVKLTDPTGAEDVVYNVTGHVWRTDIITDPDTGARIISPRTAVTVPLADLASEPTEEWTVETTDISGAISGQVMSPVFDRTIGFVTMYIEAAE